MAKRSKLRSSRRRVHNTNANLRLPSYIPRVQLSPLPLHLFEDRRRFHPLRSAAPPRSFSSFRARQVVKDKHYATAKSARLNRFSYPSQTQAIRAFAAPRRVLVCVRRNIRKEVLFASGRAGSRRIQKRPRFNENSKIRC